LISNQKILAIIPARGGSKGVSKKNLRQVGGKSLVEWAFVEGKKSKYLDRIILSSDDSEIINEATRLGCDVPFIRPADLASDETPGVAPVLHAISQLPGFDYALLLQPTSPLRSVEDIDGCIEFAFQSKTPCCVSVVEAKKTPYWMFQLDNKNIMSPLMKNDFTRRQDIPKTFVLNGALYLAEINWLKDKKSFISDDTLAYVMPEERSLDIDSEMDLLIANTLKGL
jgi:N-acylneuraminate cytidylyltransferase